MGLYAKRRCDLPEVVSFEFVSWRAAAYKNLMRRRIPLIVMAWFAACCLGIQPSAQADIFGADGNRFTIDFVSIGNAGNAADTTGYGAVPYSYRMGAHEISQDAIDTQAWSRTARKLIDRNRLPNGRGER